MEAGAQAVIIWAHDLGDDSGRSRLRWQLADLAAADKIARLKPGAFLQQSVLEKLPARGRIHTDLGPGGGAVLTRFVDKGRPYAFPSTAAGCFCAQRPSFAAYVSLLRRARRLA